MCIRAQLTVMTTTIPQLRMALRKGNCVKNTPNTTRDPTYAQKQSNNYARMPSMVELRISNTSTATTAAKRILRGDDLHPRATKKHPHQKHPTSANNELRKSRPRADTSRHEQIQVNARLGRGRIKAMWEKKGCRTITAPPSEPGSSNEHREDQDPDPKAEGIGLVTSALDENGELKKRPTRPERPETRPPSNPERHRSTTPQPAAAWQLVAAKANVLQANVLPNRQDRVGTTNETTQVREGETKKSEKSERPERSESPNNLGASVPLNLSEPRSTAVFQSPRLPIEETQPCQCLHGGLGGTQGDIENAAEKRVPEKKGCISIGNRYGAIRVRERVC